jgi:hypothetical protein
VCQVVLASVQPVTCFEDAIRLKIRPAMRTTIFILLMSLCLTAQTADPYGLQYASYTLLLVPQEKGAEGYMVGIDKEQKLTFVRISSISKAVSEGGVLPVRYGDVLQLVQQLSQENQRLKTENDHLWKVAEGHPNSTQPVIVQQQPPPPPEDNVAAQRQQMRMMLLRSLLAPQRSTVNVNVTDCSRTPALCAGR